MFKDTPVWISYWIVRGPRLWVWLRRVVSVVVRLGCSADGRPAEVWGRPDERGGGGWRKYPRRVGRWVWRLSRVLQARRVCRVCRVGLLASVIAGSGLTVHFPVVGHLLWLPLGDWAAGVLGWRWPRLRVKPLFQDLRGRLHRAYQGSMIGLGLLVVQRWLHVGWSGVMLGSRLVCERDGNRVELESQPVPEGQTTYRVHMLGAFA